MSISDIANSSITYKINDKEYKIKRLSLLDLYGTFEKLVKEKYLRTVAEYAQLINDKNEKLEFQRKAMQDVPKGQALEDAVQLEMATLDGAKLILKMVLNKCQNVTDEEIENILLDKNNSAVINQIIAHATGTDVITDRTDAPPEAFDGMIKTGDISEKKA